MYIGHGDRSKGEWGFLRSGRERALWGETTKVQLVLREGRLALAVGLASPLTLLQEAIGKKLPLAFGQ